MYKRQIWWWLTRGGFNLAGHDSTQLIRSELAELGPLSRGEKLVALVFVVTALAWVFQPLIADWVPGVNAVSYTHLDVYKRQSASSPSASCRSSGGGRTGSSGSVGDKTTHSACREIRHHDGDNHRGPSP